MKTILNSFLALNFFLFSCKNAPNKIAHEATETSGQEAHQHNNDKQTIQLNHGEKWTVDTLMLTHIRNMENDVNAFAVAGPKDYKLLADKLESNIDLLTSNCTMKGQAHDELHKWLLPYIDLATALSKASDDNEAAEQFENIQNSFKTFNQYFQ